MINLFLEFISTFDFLTDLYITTQFFKTKHLFWSSILVITTLCPFFIGQVPFIQFQIVKLRKIFLKKHVLLADQSLSQADVDEKVGRCRGCKKFLASFAITPLVIVYLILVDLFFLLVSVILTPIMTLLAILTCGKIRF